MPPNDNQARYPQLKIARWTKALSLFTTEMPLHFYTYGASARHPGRFCPSGLGLGFFQ